MAENLYLYVTPYFPSAESWRGGYCFDFVKALSKRLANKGRVYVFVPGKGDDYEIGDVKVYRFPTRQLPSSIFPFLFQRYNEKSFIDKVKSVVHFSSAESQHVICHSNTAGCGMYSLAAKRELGARAILHHHDLASFGLNVGRLHRIWLYNVIQYSILRRMHEAMDLHVFISEKSRKNFLEVPRTDTVYEDYHAQYLGLGFYRSPRIKTSLILHNGVDLGKFGRGERVEHQKFTIGCVANFEVLKDQATLIRAVARLKDNNIRVVFIGSGPLLSSCEGLAHELGLKAEFRSELPHEQLADFYRSLDLFVLPSYFEGFGCVFTEAWSCGVPFITCEGQGIDDLIYPEDRHLWLAKPCDPEDLANKISNYIANRPVQRLSGPVDIDTLVSGYLQKLEEGI